MLSTTKWLVFLSSLHDPTLILLIHVYHKYATIDGTSYSKCPTNEKHSTCEISIHNSTTYLNLSGGILGVDPITSIITNGFHVQNMLIVLDSIVNILEGIYVTFLFFIVIKL